MLAIRTSSKLTHVSMVKFFGLIVLALLMFASSATAEGPKEQLQDTIDGIIRVLKTIRTPADIDRNKKSIRQLLLTRFDFAAMAQRSLGNRWNDLRGNQQEFVSVFTDFVEHGYMSTLGSYRGEKVVYDPRPGQWRICRSGHASCRRGGGGEQKTVQTHTSRAKSG